MGWYARFPAAQRCPLSADIPVVTTPNMTKRPKTQDKVLSMYAQPAGDDEPSSTATDILGGRTRTSVLEGRECVCAIEVCDDSEHNDLGQHCRNTINRFLAYF